MRRSEIPHLSYGAAIHNGPRGIISCYSQLPVNIKFQTRNNITAIFLFHINSNTAIVGDEILKKEKNMHQHELSIGGTYTYRGRQHLANIDCIGW